MPDPLPQPSATVSAKVPAPDAPDKASGLTGMPKVIATIGVIGAFIVLFSVTLGYVLRSIPESIDKAIESVTNDSTENRKLWREDIKTERDRAEKNREHSEAIVKRIYERDREKTKEILDVLRAGQDVTRANNAELEVIRKLLYEQSRTLPKPAVNP